MACISAMFGIALLHVTSRRSKPQTQHHKPNITFPRQTPNITFPATYVATYSVHSVAEIRRFYPFRLAPQPTPSKNLAIRPVDDSPEYGSQLA